jgi:thymidylate synthase (FAD)
MELIKQSHKIWGRCPSDMQGALKWIERAGRVCYASEDKITEDSALPFIQNLIERGHLSVLEHSEISVRLSWKSKYITNWDPSGDGVFESSTGNLRAIMELYPTDKGKNTLFQKWLNGDLNDFVIQPPKEQERYTVEFTTNRAMTHEIVRHRPCSFSQQSQRYIRYGDKNSMQFIEPVDFQDWSERAKDIFARACVDAMENYHQLIFNQGLKPQQARNILPNACATKIVVTADRKEWELIFGLRCGGGADPQMIDLMTPVREEMLQLWGE